MQKPSIPKGTRDFSPEETAKRNYIFDTIRSVFRLYGFKQIETPAMENLATLMGKYGEEGDKLLFKILNSGDFLSEISDDELLNGKTVSFLTHKICEKGLRYDLTVPFARYVVMHRNEITFPFKRFQIQPVWRADRPQKGRYREFYQCDADMIGSNSLLNEIELIQIMDEVYRRFGIRVCIKINNRKILSGIAEIIGEAGKITDITVAIDKLDKIGLEKVNEELAARGISETAIAQLQPIILLSGSNREKLNALKNILKNSETGLKGVAEIDTILNKTDLLALDSVLELDLTLARGLNYYTGAIFEVKALDVEIGSITGGGRYDNLTGVFGLPDVSGVGISFGADRIFDVLNQLNLYPENSGRQTQVLFVNFGEKEENYLLPLLSELRKSGISAEIYPEAAKLKKQFSYADDNHIPFVAVAGENEIGAGKITLKNMATGEQQCVEAGEIVGKLREFTGI
ncbi:MAG: histidine--tRNA ligase [Dysgonamonadaceae bacterium]|jgi:histidyl-tRNA synthetase|nr:histidine--tRNA ligase [Dysgonamonadaceae bacterium]